MPRDEQRKLDYMRARRDVRMELIRRQKSRPCADCGVQYPWFVMQFDHLRDKFAGVKEMKSYSLQRLMDEIAKCDVVCANCHCARTYARSHA